MVDVIAVAIGLLKQFDKGKLTYVELSRKFVSMANENPNDAKDLMELLETCQDEPDEPYYYRKNMRN